MNRVEQTLVSIGHVSADAMKILTGALVLDHFRASASRDTARGLSTIKGIAASMANLSRGATPEEIQRQISADQLGRFASTLTEQSAMRIAAWVANDFFDSPSRPQPRLSPEDAMVAVSAIGLLAVDDEYCSALSGAMYNYCYARYLETGHRIGVFSHPFLGFARALNAFAAGRESLQLAESFHSSVGTEAMVPLLKLCEPFQMFRALPHSPDSTLLLKQVVTLASLRGHGDLFAGASDRSAPPPPAPISGRTMPRAPRPDASPLRTSSSEPSGIPLWRPDPAQFPALAMEIGDEFHRIRLAWWSNTLQVLREQAHFEVPRAAHTLSGEALAAVASFQVVGTGDYMKDYPHIDRPQANGWVNALFHTALGPDHNAWGPYLSRYHSTLTPRDHYRLAKDLVAGPLRPPAMQSESVVLRLTVQAAALSQLSIGTAANVFRNPAAREVAKQRLTAVMTDPGALYEALKALPRSELE